MFRVRKGIKGILDKEVVCLQVHININIKYICKAYKCPDHMLLEKIIEKIKKF